MTDKWSKGCSLVIVQAQSPHRRAHHCRRALIAIYNYIAIDTAHVHYINAGADVDGASLSLGRVIGKPE